MHQRLLRSKAHKSRYHAISGRPQGAMLGLQIRHVLWIRATPELVQEYFPENFMRGRRLVSTAAIGFRQNGLVFIGTRHPQAAEQAMQTLLPGKRLGTAPVTTGLRVTRAGEG
jgi:hypothetical protein